MIRYSISVWCRFKFSMKLRFGLELGFRLVLDLGLRLLFPVCMFEGWVMVRNSVSVKAKVSIRSRMIYGYS